MKKISISIGLSVLLLIFLSSCMKKTGNSLIHELEREPEAVSVTDSIKIFPDLVPDAGFNNTRPKYVRTLSDEEYGYNEEETIKPIYPKMIEIHDEKHNLNLEISETLVTVEEYKNYLILAEPSGESYFEKWADDVIGWTNGRSFQDDWPIFFISWESATEYCNWLSIRENLQPVYSHDFFDKIVIDRNANGYRLPYIRELIILSDFGNNLSKEEYENTFGEKEPFSVYEGKKNRYSIYDLLENLPQYCNDYYLKGYDYFDYEKNSYGPEEYTPNNKATAFVVNGQIDDTEKEPLLCAFGCYSNNESNDSAQENVIHAISMYNKNNTIGIRIVRNLPASE